MSAQSNLAKGIILVVFGAFWFTVMSAVGKYLLPYFHPMQIVFFRNLGTLIISTIFIRQALPALLKSNKKHMYLVRGGISQCAVVLWFMAIAYATLPEVTAISFSTPLFAALIAWLVLGENVTFTRWLGIFIGLLGIIVIIHPDMSRWQEGYFYAIGASVCWAANAAVVKTLSKTESPGVIVFNLMLIITIFSLPGALMHWQPIPSSTWIWLTVLGVSTFAWQYCLAAAYRYGSITEIQPFEYCRLIFACLIAAMLFAEPLDAQTIIGSLIVFMSGFVGLRRRAKPSKVPAEL